MTAQEKIIITVPGLGGHSSAFGQYEKELRDYKVINLELIDIPTLEHDLRSILKVHPGSIILANCYGATPVLRILPTLPPGSIRGLIILEPYFAEFFWWRKPALYINKIIIAVMRGTDRIGLKRRSHVRDIDYVYLSKYPLFIQPLFDMLHQSLTDYFVKIDDILTFAAPGSVELQTLLIFSPQGYSQDEARRQKIIRVFPHSRTEIVQENTHNIVSVSISEIVEIIKDWITTLP